MTPPSPPPAASPRFNSLPYRKPTEGRDYWIRDGALPNAREVAERCWASSSWDIGAPRRRETWPGQRAPGALLPEELAPIEAWVREVTGARALGQEKAPGGGSLSHNYVQVVAAPESGPRPHTDSLRLCTFAAVLYLHPAPLPRSGTSFYRLRLPNGALGGNTCPPGAYNLAEALGVRFLPLEIWQEELAVENVFNRLLLYRADRVHSATGYFGGAELRSRRMAAVFFWKALG